ncbi:hypothetical protein FACS189459_0150 [Bacilli bacterium]|nr:hypothetical protein FACS189459_0150 [Bacilli bacterium]
MTEKIYTNMFNDFKSIMLEQYPNKIKVKKIDIEKVSLFESAFSYVHNMRIKHSIK